MDSEPPASQSVRLEDLPTEIIALVVSYLDLKTANSLSVTSTALQPHAEKRLWERLSSQPRNCAEANAHDVPPRPTASTAGANQLDGYRSALLPGKTIRTLNEMLDKYPWRASAVRSLELPLCHTVPSELAYLLTCLAGTLRKLNISMPSGALAIPEVVTYGPLPQIFSSLPAPLVSLVRRAGEPAVGGATSDRPAHRAGVRRSEYQRPPSTGYVRVFHRTPSSEAVEAQVGFLVRPRSVMKRRSRA